MVAALGMTMRRSVGISDGCRDVMLLYAQANFSHWILHRGAYLAETWRHNLGNEATKATQLQTL